MVRRKPMKGFIMNLKTGVRRQFQFNPTPIEETRTNEFVEMKSPGLSSPYFQYVGGEANTYVFTIELDDKGMPYSHTFFTLNFLRQFKPDIVTQFQTPPPIMLAYGTGNRVITGIVTELNIERDMFLPQTLLPIRAKVDIEIKELPIEGDDLESRRGRLGSAWY